jgi:hypothetical protein
MTMHNVIAEPRIDRRVPSVLHQRRARPHWCAFSIFTLRLIVFTTILIAAGFKLLELDHFTRELAAWHIIPSGLAPWLAIVAVSAEISLPLLWLIRPSRSWPTIAAIAMLAMFTIAFSVESAIASPPNCACFGRILAYEQHRSGLAPLLVRNGALIAALTVSLVLPRIAPARIGS